MYSVRPPQYWKDAVLTSSGDHLSLSDLHLAGWLGRIFMLVGVDVNEDGKTAVTKLSAHIKGSVGEKVVVFWDTIKERESFKKVYGSGLV